MLVAAYLVGGFLIASVYAVGMLRGRRDRYHRLGFIIAVHRRRDRDPDPDGRRRLARAVGLQQRSRPSSRRSSWSRRPASDVPETLLGHLNSDGTVSGGIPIPGLARGCPIRADGKNTVDPGPRHASRPTSGRRTREVEHRAPRVGRDGRARHAAVPVVALVRADLGVPARLPKTQLVPAHRGRRRRCCGDHDGGGLGRHRGRPPTLDRAQLHEGRGGRDRQHRRLDHVHRGGRRSTRRRRHDDPGAARHEPALPRPRNSTSPTTPYGPSDPGVLASQSTARRCRCR